MSNKVGIVRSDSTNLTKFSVRSLALFSTIALLGACGGGGGGGGGGGDGGNATASVVIQGTVTADAPLGNTTVSARGASGDQVETSTDANGNYTVDVKGLEAPYVLKVVDDGEEMYSIAFEEGVANVNALSNVVVENYFSLNNEDVDSFFSSSRSLSNAPSQTDINDIFAAFQSLLSTAYELYSVADDFNFLYSDFSSNYQQVTQFLNLLTIDVTNNVLNMYITDESTNVIANILIDASITTDFTAGNTSAPTVVTNVNAVPGLTNIMVTWDEASDDIGVAGYNVYLDSGSVPLATVVAPIFNHQSLLPMTEHCYEIEAFDGQNNRSARSSTQCATTEAEADVTPPSSVTGVTASAITSSSVELVWDPSPENDVVGYNVLRKSGASFVQHATVTSELFVDDSLDGSTEYCYQIQAYDAAGNLAINSNAYCATTEAPIVLDQEPPVTSASLAAGEYDSVQTLEFSCSDNGGSGCTATYYTTDGSDPVSNPTEYVGPIAINETQTVSVYSVDNDGNEEAVQTFEYVISLPMDLDAPVSSASPASGTYDNSVLVQLGCNDGDGSGCSAIYYTTDGSEPTTDSAVYTSAILIDEDTTLKFFSEDNSGNQELVVTEEYFITTPDGFTLAVSSSDPSGTITSDVGSIICGFNCSDTYAVNTQVILTATHAQGYRAIWNGCETIGENQCSIKVTNDENISVSFNVILAENESNDTFSDADLITISSDVEGFFNSVSDEDYFKFEVSERGTFYATSNHASITNYLYLYDANRSEIARSGYRTAHTLDYSLNPGTYYVRLISYNGQFDETIPYNLRLTGSVFGDEGSDLNEENDSFSTAFEIDSGGEYQGNFDTENDSDYYTFEVSERGTFYATVAHQSVRSYMYLYDVNRSEMVRSGYSTAHTLDQSLDPGTYYLRLVSYSTDYDKNISYDLMFSGSVFGDTGQDSNEENDSFASATNIVSSGTYQGNFDTENDSDYFMFEVSERGTFYATAAHQSVRSYMYLYDVNRSEMVRSGYNTSHTLDQSLDPGTYYLRLVSYSTDYDKNISYDLMVSGSVFGDAGQDSNEENDSFASATNIDSSGIYQGNFDTENDSDYFMFEVSERGAFYATVAHQSVRSYMYLYDANRSEMVRSGYRFAHTLDQSLEPGTYYLRLVSYSTDYDKNISYDLTLSGSVFGDAGQDSNEENDSFTSATNLDSSGTYQGNFDTENDSDFFMFEVSERGTFYATVAHQSVRSYMYLYDVNRSEMVRSGYNTAHTLDQSLDPGTYYLRLVSYSTDYDKNISYDLMISGSVFGDAGQDSNEENDSFASATSIDSSGSYQGNFDTENDSDYFKFVVTGPVDFSATVAHQSVQSYMYLYSADKAEIDRSGRDTAHTITQSLEPGTYYIRVVSFSTSYDKNIAYSLELSGDSL